MKQVILTFNEDGSAKVEAHGFKGKGCEQATAPFEAVLGLDTSGRVKKPEYQQTERQAVKAGR